VAVASPTKGLFDKGEVGDSVAEHVVASGVTRSVAAESFLKPRGNNGWHYLRVNDEPGPRHP